MRDLEYVFVFLHQGAAVVHFQDFNAEVLQSLTIPNVNVNISKEFHCTASDEKNCDSGVELRFFAGDWAQIHRCLPHVHNSEEDLNCCSEQCPVSGYDIILMAETIYSLSAQQSLYGLIKKVFHYRVILYYIIFHYKFMVPKFQIFSSAVCTASLWSGIYGSKKVLFWSWWRNTPIPIHGRERW